MPEEQTGAVAEPAAGVSVDGGQASETQTAEAEAQAAPIEQETRSVPLEALKAVRDENQTVKQKLEQLTEQNRLYQAQLAAQNQGQQPQATQQPTQSPDLFAGTEPDDMVTIGHLRALANEIKGIKQDLSGVSSTVGQVAQANVMQSSDGQLVQQKLEGFIRENPSFLNDIKSHPKPIEFAARLIRQSEKGAQAQQAQPKAPAIDPMAQLQQIIDNQNKPKSPAGVPTGTSADIMSRIKTMSDAEFLEEDSKLDA